MKKICFLDGHLILREHKTGVHYFHQEVAKRLCLDNLFDCNIAYFEKKDEHSVHIKDNEWIKKYTNVCKGKKRILSYLLPIEIFFKKNDVYICDGLCPHTFYRSKKVAIVFDMMVEIYPENYSTLKRIYLKNFFNKLKKMDLIFCISETTKNDIVKYYHIDESKIINCYCGVDETDYIGDDIENKYIDKNEKYFLYIGDMRKNKNMFNMIEGFFLYCEKNIDAKEMLYIAGKKGEEYINLKQMIDKSVYKNRVRFLGYISENDKSYLYKNAEAILLLSFYEGFGIPVIEAMRHYKPIITSNCSSMREIGEGAAILADPSDVTDIAKKIALSVNNYEINVDKYNEKIKKYNFDNVASIIEKNLLDMLGDY